MKYHFLVINRNHTVVWSGDFDSETEAWNAYRQKTKVPENFSTEQLVSSPQTSGRYGLRMVSWPY